MPEQDARSRAPLDVDPRWVEEALASSLGRLTKAAGADGGLVLLHKRSGGRLLVRAPVSLDARTVFSIGERCARGELEPEGLRSVYRESGFPGWTVVPLDTSGIAAGVLHLVSRSQGFSVDPSLEPLVREVSTIANALRFLELARAADARGEVVARFARGVLTHLEFDTLFPELMRLVSDLCPCDAASMAVRREGEAAFELVATFGPGLPAEIKKGAVIAEGETPIALAWNGDLVVEQDCAKSAFPRARLLAAGGIYSSLYAPVGEPERRGVLCVGRARPSGFDEEDILLYRSLVPFLDIALRNAELIAKMRGAYRELEATQEKLVKAERLRALGEIAAGVAHEIGNTLAVMSTNAALVANRITDPELKALVVTCGESVAKAEKSVSKVLELARDPLDRKDRKRARLDQVALEAVEVLRPRWRDAARSRGLSFEVDTSRVQAVPEAAIAPDEARDAIVRVLTNAIEASPRGGRIAVATSIDDDSVIVTVDDDGPGIAVEDRERCLEPFFTTRGPGRAGLGLTQVARLARQIGGSIRVLSSPLGGARIQVRVPCQELGSGPQELPKPAPEKRGPLRAIKVLLVEDEPSLRRALPQLLKLRGQDVTAVGDVSSALEFLQRSPSTDVLVTDLGLPGRSGWDLVDSVHARFPEVSIVVLSGWGALTDPVVARERGVAAVLAKPTSERDLALTIESVVAERKAQLS